MKPRDLENLLERFVLEFAKDEKRFLKIFMRLSYYQLRLIVKYSYTQDPVVLNKQENLVDLCNEILGYYFYLYNKKESLELKTEDFNLRKETSVKVFLKLLDNLIRLAELNPEKFLEVLPCCPVFAWDKILDLAESSFKGNKDSKIFAECLKRSKLITNTYASLFKTMKKHEGND
jgi:hypothetical protein